LLDVGVVARVREGSLVDLRHDRRFAEVLGADAYRGTLGHRALGATVVSAAGRVVVVIAARGAEQDEGRQHGDHLQMSAHRVGSFPPRGALSMGPHGCARARPRARPPGPRRRPAPAAPATAPAAARPGRRTRRWPGPGRRPGWRRPAVRPWWGWCSR